MIDMDWVAAQARQSLRPGFEGRWHAIEFQPELAVPQRFVIGVALSTKGKLVRFRVANEAPRLKCFYEQRYSNSVWKYLRQELESELTERTGLPVTKYVSGSPQVHLGAGHYVSGTSEDAALNRTFERIVTVVRKDKPVRLTGMAQAELRSSVSNLLKRQLQLRFDAIAQPEQGMIIKEGEVLHYFDVQYDNTKVACSVVSAFNSGLETTKLNMYQAWNDLNALNRIRPKEQIGLAVLKPAPKFLPQPALTAWQDWWSDFTYKLRSDNRILLAEETEVSVLADQIGDWFSVD